MVRNLYRRKVNYTRVRINNFENDGSKNTSQELSLKELLLDETVLFTSCISLKKIMYKSDRIALGPSRRNTSQGFALKDPLLDETILSETDIGLK